MSPSQTRHSDSAAPLRKPIPLWVYLADQHPDEGRSIGISRMTRTVLGALEASGAICVRPVVSGSSMDWPGAGKAGVRMPWSTRPKWLRLLADHAHPWFVGRGDAAQAWYYPKGFLPYSIRAGRFHVVTVHDVIIQHYLDHYPGWRSRWDYSYWIALLRHTFRKADRILTVSETAKRQIETFITRHGLPVREVTVTYQPCAYEGLEQPEHPSKETFVLHLASREPHKKTARLVRWWCDCQAGGRHLPLLRLIGDVPPEVARMVTESVRVEHAPFVADEQLQATYRAARALVISSEIEGFGLPAVEAYFLGTPVCFARGTSIEEVLAPATAKGAFSLDDPDSLFAALDQVLAMSPGEVHDCGLRLRETYASDKVVARMIRVFEGAAGKAGLGGPAAQ